VKTTLLVVLSLLLVVVPGFEAADGSQARYRLVTAKDAEGLERRLQLAAGDGYSMLAAAQGIDVTGRPKTTALLERVEGGPVAFRVLACSGSLQEPAIRDALAALGTEGYRLAPGGITARKIEDFWLPESAYEDQMLLTLEKLEDGATYGFESLAFGEYDPFYRALDERRAEGYDVIGMWNTGRNLQIVLQQRTDEGAPRGVYAVDGHRLLLMATRLVLAGKLESAASEGYRILAAEDPSTTGPPVILMQKIAASDNVVDYKFLDDVPVRQTKDKVAKKLSKRGREGWQITRGGTTAEVITLERPHQEALRTTRAEYRMISSRSASGLPQLLETAVAEGFEFVRLYVEPDETTVLVERRSER
jgi:hypothetical protein